MASSLTKWSPLKPLLSTSSRNSNSNNNNASTSASSSGGGGGVGGAASGSGNNNTNHNHNYHESSSSGGSSSSKKNNGNNNGNSKSHSSSSSRNSKPKPSSSSGSKTASSLLSIPQAVKLSMLNSGVISIKDEHSKLLSTMANHPVDKETFLKLCDERRKFPILYKVEFQLGCKSTTNSADSLHSFKHGQKLKNKEKNQNQLIIPFDYNRVVLEPNPPDFPSDYVNASYVDSLLEPNAYIVAQGPTEFTVDDFWRMIWQKNVTNIIMLTKTFDFIKVMCIQYWPIPPKTSVCFGGLKISVVEENKLANFYIRTLRVELVQHHSSSSTASSAAAAAAAEPIFREVVQFHYVEWPCHSGPFPTALLDFRRRIHQVYSLKPEVAAGQTLIHCSDGAGRSGVYCEVDANLELLDEDGLLDVFGYLKKLRGARRGLVEDVDQIKFIYDTLEEYVICRKTWFPVAELSQRLKHKSQKEGLTKINEYQKEFLLICKQTPRFTIGDCAGGHRADNRDKNRDVLVIPPDNFRPYLTSFQGNTFTDYINAVFVDSYTQSRGYIVTEWPLLETCSYLWSLVYDYDASAVVILSNPESSTTYPPFWPTTNRSKKYGPVFTIDPLSQEHYQNIKSWAFRINKKIVSLTELMAGVKAEPKTCKFFQLTCWPMEHKVPTSTNSLVELMNMVERWKQKCQSTGPVVVISPDGRSRAGVYCAANACIEQVIQYGEVDVFTAVKTVRRHRPQLIDNMTEYKYCYDVVLHYVLHYLNKEASGSGAAGSISASTTSIAKAAAGTSSEPAPQAQSSSSTAAGAPATAAQNTKNPNTSINTTH